MSVLYGNGMRLAPILDPSKRKPGPKPAQVDLHRVFFIGTFIWCIAALACLILLFVSGEAWAAPLIICTAGMIIGVLMLIWEHFNRWYYRRLGNGVTAKWTSKKEPDQRVTAAYTHTAQEIAKASDRNRPAK